MKKFRLSRKRKKKYKLESNKLIVTFYSWNWFYFRKRVEVESMFVIKNCNSTGEINTETGIWTRYKEPKINTCSNEDLLNWYKEHYPNDKLSHHFCKQNRTKFY